MRKVFFAFLVCVDKRKKRRVGKNVSRLKIVARLLLGGKNAKKNSI